MKQDDDRRGPSGPEETTVRKSLALTALREQRDATLRRLRALEPEAWERPCLPGWQVRDVVAHLISTDEASVTGRLFVPLLRSEGRRAFERWNESAILRWNRLPPDELIAGLERWGQRLARMAATVPSVAARVPLSGPFGRQPLLFLLERRIVDEWVHEEDVAAATVEHGGREILTVPRPAVSAVLADEVLACLPHLVLPRIERVTGVVRLVVDLTLPSAVPPQPPQAPRVWGIDFARRQFGPRVTGEPDVTVRIPAAALALVAEDRVRWTDLAEPFLAVDGDKELAAALLDALPPPPGD